jgi:quercetin dioxygenase-like cupin family protein
MSLYFPEASEFTRRTIFPGVHIQTCAAKEMMLSFVNLDAGAVVEAHSHPHEQVGIVILGKAQFEIGDEVRILGPGDMYRIPGGVRHRVVVVEGPCQALDIFHPIREDYL